MKLRENAMNRNGDTKAENWYEKTINSGLQILMKVELATHSYIK